MCLLFLFSLVSPKCHDNHSLGFAHLYLCINTLITYRWISPCCVVPCSPPCLQDAASAPAPQHRRVSGVWRAEVEVLPRGGRNACYSSERQQQTVHRREEVWDVRRQWVAGKKSKSYEPLGKERMCYAKAVIEIMQWLLHGELLVLRLS